MLTDFLSHQAGKLVVDGMSWTSGDDSSFDGLTDESHITDDIKQLMASTFVVPL